NTFLANLLVQMYGTCGRLSEARLFFLRMPELDVVAWNSMLVALAAHGESRDAIELFGVMQIEGTIPDEVSFMGALAACSHLGLLAQGWRYFVSITESYTMLPTSRHYCFMIDMLGKSGRAEEAHELLETMPFVPDAVAW
ncbi:hypothetical protein SELMODRAFT_72464, partial [Selaginella moellendorffii]